MGDGFFTARVDELVRGYRKNEAGDCACIICGESFQGDRAYPAEGEILLAPGAAARHCAEAHGGMFEVLLALDKRYTGLSEGQKRMLALFRKGLDDAAVAEKAEVGLSTVRSYRFSFRERVKEAKAFLALASIVEEDCARLGARPEGDLVPIHRTAVQVDERFAVSEDEEREILAEYLSGEGTGLVLKSFPKKEKRKIVVLRRLAGLFGPGTRYSEREVNELLFPVHPDTATLRRYLVEYGFLAREPGGAAYWVKE
jgi:hypothetical protein